MVKSKWWPSPSKLKVREEESQMKIEGQEREEESKDRPVKGVAGGSVNRALGLTLCILFNGESNWI